MGSVFVARDEVLGREVAVKAIRRSAMYMGGAERFANEGRTVAQLAHPNVVRVFDVGSEAGVPYLVMELAAGGSLKDRLARGPMSVQEVRTLGIQIAHALAAAHDRGIVHRDVKPANVLEASPGVWKLADFGIAHAPDVNLTITGQFLGSPVYAAPECIRTGSFGAASDIYGLACTLYEAATGHKPHGGRSIEARLRPDDDSARIHSAALAELDAPGLVDALARGFASAPSDRPSAAAFASLIAAGPAIARPAVAPPAPRSADGRPQEGTEFIADSVVRPPRRRASRRAWVAALGALAAIVLVAVIASRGGATRAPAAASGSETAEEKPVAIPPPAPPTAPAAPTPPEPTAPDATMPSAAPGELRAVTPHAALEDERAARAWNKIVERLYEHEFDEAREKLVEWERAFGETEDTRSLRSQLDAVIAELRRRGGDPHDSD